MPLPTNPNLPLFVGKTGSIASEGLPDIPTISINVMKKSENASPSPFGSTPNPTDITDASSKPQYICSGVLDIVRPPDEWIAKQGVVIPEIRITSEGRSRTLYQATFMCDPKSGSFFIEAQKFE